MRWSAAAVAAATVLLSVPATSYAQPTTTAGLTCGLATTTDVVGVLANPGTEIGYVWGGPVAAADLPTLDDGVLMWDIAGNPFTVTIGCDVQLSTPRFSEPDYLSTTATGSPAAVVLPTFVLYQTLPTNPVFLCTTLTVTDARGASRIGYFDAATKTFVRNADDAECDVAIAQEAPPQGVCDLLPNGCMHDTADVRVVVPSAITP
jgi:hypothetical protein